jgi:hypothetical protein
MNEGPIQTPTRREHQLLDEMALEQETAHRVARSIEVRIIFCKWASLILGGAASFAGLVADTPPVKAVFTIETWHLGVIGACATAFEVVRRNANWRAKSDLAYWKRDRLRSLRERLLYEIPATPNPEQIASISRERREVITEYGSRLSALNAESDRRASGRSA